MAAQEGHTAIVQLLIDYGVDKNYKNAQGVSPLILVARNGHIDTVRFLLEKGVSPNSLTLVDGLSCITPLFIAAQKGHFEVVQLLLQYKANTELSMPAGLTPLYTAVQNKRLRVIRLLIDSDANVKSPFFDGITLLELANSMGIKPIVERFLLYKSTDDI